MKVKELLEKSDNTFKKHRVPLFSNFEMIKKSINSGSTQMPVEIIDQGNAAMDFNRS